MKRIVMVLSVCVLLFSQCKKEEMRSVCDDVEMVPATFELSMNNAKSDFTGLLPDGVINWGNDGSVERIYVGCGVTHEYYIYDTHENKTVGELYELKGTYDEDNNKILFTGTLPARYIMIDEVCSFFYFGNNGRANSGTNVENIYMSARNIIAGKKMDFSKQTGNINDLGDYHIASIKAIARGIYDDDGKLASFNFELESFENVMSIAMLDLEGETVLGGTATQLKSYSIEWDMAAETHIEKFEFVEGGTYDVTENAGSKSFIALLPTEETVTLECSKGRCEFGQGIERNHVYVGKVGNSIDDSLPLTWE